MKHEHYLQAMGIDVWRERDSENISAAESCLAKTTQDKQEPVLRSLDEAEWDRLEQQAKACEACGLQKTRTQVVFGTGNRNADVLIIGEAPGAEEDKQGEPFIGPAGQLLTKMLQAINLQREDVYIANILKCRPPNNRDPKSDEASLCTPFLTKQIELLKPKVILVLGRIAAQFLLENDLSMSQLRSKIFTYSAQQIPLIVTYHPAYLLRAPTEKRKAWDDLKLLQQHL